MPMTTYFPRRFLTDGEHHVFNRLKNILDQQGNSGFIVAKASLLQIIRKCKGGKLYTKELSRQVSSTSRGEITAIDIEAALWSESVDIVVFPMTNGSVIPQIDENCTAVFVDRSESQIVLLSGLMACIGLRTFFVNSHGDNAMIMAEEAAGNLRSGEAQNRWEALCAKSARRIFDNNDGYHVFIETRLGEIIRRNEPSSDDASAVLKAMKGPAELFIRQHVKNEEKKEAAALNNRAVDIAVWDERINQIVVVVEFDGQHHFTEEQFKKDRLRDSMLASARIPVIRISINSKSASRQCDYILERFSLYMCHIAYYFSARTARSDSIQLRSLLSSGAGDEEIEEWICRGDPYGLDDERAFSEQRDFDLWEVRTELSGLGISSSVEIEPIENSATTHVALRVKFNNEGSVKSSGEFDVYVYVGDIVPTLECMTARQRWERRVEEAKAGDLGWFVPESVREKIIASSPPDERAHGLVPKALAIAVYEAAMLDLLHEKL